MEIWPKTPHVVLLITRSTSDHKLEEKKFQAQFEVRATILPLDATRREPLGWKWSLAQQRFVICGILNKSGDYSKVS